MHKERPQIKEVPETETLNLKNDRVTASISSQGALLESLLIDGDEVVYQPREDNPKRGGIPVLGPTPGPTKGASWEHVYPEMPSHGTDRITNWDVVSRSERAVTLRRYVGPNEFLFAGKLEVSVELVENGLILTKSITNHEDKPREIGHAFHPYFAVGTDTTFQPQTIADHHPLTNGEATIVSPGEPVVYMQRGQSRYVIEANPNPVQTVIWTDNQNLYECIEPWWAEIGAGITIGPRETKTFSLKILKN